MASDKPLPLGVGIPAKIEHQPPHGVRRIHAVIEHSVPVSIPGHGLILNERADQIGERLLRNPVLLRPCPRSATKTGCCGLARIHAVQFAAPPVQLPQAFGRIADLVGQIVGPPAIGVDVVEILVQMLSAAGS